MAENKESTRRKKTQDRRKAKKLERRERRLSPARSNVAMLTMGGAIVGGLAMGAGAYGQWLSDAILTASPYMMAGGAVVLAAVILWGDMEGSAIRVGDAGVALEEAGKAAGRIAWCDMERIVLKDGTVQIEGKEGGIRFKVLGNPLAAAWVMKEAMARIPSRLEAHKSDQEALPKTSLSDGEQLDVEPLQVTGRRCRASERTITFERDARFCPRCGEVYHEAALPEQCKTCQADLSELAEE